MGFLFHVKDLFLAAKDSACNLVKRFGSWAKQSASDALRRFVEFVDDMWEKAEKAFQAAKVFPPPPPPPLLSFLPPSLLPLFLSSYDFLGVCASEGGNIHAIKRDRC
jgi:hypothetical protein